MKVLFVCTGNICRSPMAEVIFKNLCNSRGRKDVHVGGAGTFAISGQQMTEEAFEALKACGEKVVNIDDMTATAFVRDMIDEYDFIITMAKSHADYIGAFKNVKSLDEYVGCGDIFDPYGYPLSTYVEVCSKLQKALGVLYDKILCK